MLEYVACIYFTIKLKEINLNIFYKSLYKKKFLH